MTLEEFFKSNLKKNIIDFRLHFNAGASSFYIHPLGVDGDTMDFSIRDNTVNPMNHPRVKKVDWYPGAPEDAVPEPVQYGVFGSANYGYIVSDVEAMSPGAVRIGNIHDSLESAEAERYRLTKSAIKELDEHYNKTSKALKDSLEPEA